MFYCARARANISPRTERTYRRAGHGKRNAARNQWRGDGDHTDVSALDSGSHRQHQEDAPHVQRSEKRELVGAASGGRRRRCRAGGG